MPGARAARRLRSASCRAPAHGDRGSIAVTESPAGRAVAKSRLASRVSRRGWAMGQFETAWWQRAECGYRGERLHFAGIDLQQFAARSGTPAFVYSADRVRANLGRLQAALTAEG